MSSAYMARLGGYVFSLDTAAFQTLQRVSAWRWQQKDRIGRKPAQQMVGPGADTIELSGVVFPHYRGGLAQVAALRAQADVGDPLPLVYAFDTVGQYCGLWCVRELREGRTVFWSNGAPRRVEFSMSLVEYGEDAVAGGAVLAALGGVVAGVDVAGAGAAAAGVLSAARAVASPADAADLLPRVALAGASVGSAAGALALAVSGDQHVRRVAGVLSSARRMWDVAGDVSDAAAAVADAGTLAAFSGAAASLGDGLQAVAAAAAAGAGGVGARSLLAQRCADVVSACSDMATATDAAALAADEVMGGL